GDAHTVCDRIFDRNDPDKLTLLGMVYGRHGRYEDSLPPLQAAARLDPDSFEIFHNLGVSYFRLRRYSDAEAQLSRSIALRPDYFGSNALLGATLYLLKRDEEAYRVLDHAHQLNPSSEETATLLFQEAMLLGQRNFQGRNYEDAVRYWRKAAGIRPDDPAVQERIAGAMALAAEERH
ncbi:MAG TPA: tetratricopeptide repeat protein, partial [Bryobacteraceae bacterium]|nr:tetratricopeptide repeat protein [Bryobacteraceae bacterium]